MTNQTRPADYWARLALLLFGFDIKLQVSGWSAVFQAWGGRFSILLGHDSV